MSGCNYLEVDDFGGEVGARGGCLSVSVQLDQESVRRQTLYLIVVNHMHA